MTNPQLYRYTLDSVRGDYVKEKGMKRILLLGLLVGMLLVVTACSMSLPAGDKGNLALTPFSSEEFSLRGVVPWACSQAGPGASDCTGLSSNQSLAVLLQQSVPVPLGDLGPSFLAQVSLEEFPESTATYKGTAFTWNLYTFEAQIYELGTEIYRVDLALAEGDSTSYSVALITSPDDYEANVALYDTLFTHVLYALAPLP
jgi:hypothetical protein